MLVLEYMHTILIGNKKSKLVGHDQEDTHTHSQKHINTYKYIPNIRLRSK